MTKKHIKRYKKIKLKVRAKTILEEYYNEDITEELTELTEELTEDKDKRFNSTYTFGDSGVIKDFCNNPLGTFISPIFNDTLSTRGNIQRKECRLFENSTLAQQKEFRSNLKPRLEMLDLLSKNKSEHYNSTLI